MFPRFPVRSLMICMLAGAVHADVTVSRVVKSGGMGGMGGSQTQSVEYYRGDNQRSDQTVKFDNFLMNKMGGGEHSEITRVAEDKVIAVNHKKKTYQEKSISQMAEDMKKAMAATTPEAKEGKPAKPNARITKSEFKVEPTGEKKTINGFACELYRATMLVETENLETKQKSTSRLVTDQWTTGETPALKALREESLAFSQAYLKKLGWSVSPKDMQQMGFGMMNAALGVDEKDFQARLTAFTKEMSKIKGQTIVTETKWFMDSTAAPKQASTGRPKAEESGAVDLSGGPMGALGGLAGRFAKKKAEKAATAKESSGDAPFFSSYSEIKEVKTGALPADTFQIPTGYKLEK